MCYAIFAVLILLFAVYSHDLLEPLALSATTGDGQWMTLALGWEMVAHLWPLLVLAAIVSSMLTYFVTRRILAGGSGCGSC